MDETGLILSKLLLFDYLMPYLALADALGLSVNAVHKRIQSMVEESVIRGFTTKFSLSRARIGFGTPNKIRIFEIVNNCD